MMGRSGIVNEQTFRLRADFGRVTYSSEGLLAVEFLSGVNVVVDEGEASGSATTELGLQAENRNVLLLGLEGLSELGLDVSLGNVGNLRVDQLDHLIAFRKGRLTHCLLARRGFFKNLRAYKMNFLSAIFKAQSNLFN